MEKYTKTVQFLIGIIVFVAGMGISWGVVTTKVSGVDKNTASVVELDKRVKEIEINSSVNAEIFRSIKEDIEEIKKDVKDILNAKEGKSNANKQKQ